MMKKLFMVILLVTALMSAGVVMAEGSDEKAQPSWTLTQLKGVDGLDLPESVHFVPSTKQVFASNIVTSTKGYWEDDGTGFISTLNADGSIAKLRWMNSSKTTPLNGPKGISSLGSYLYFADNTRLIKTPLSGDGETTVIAPPGAIKLNDIATDGQHIYVSDYGKSEIYKIDKEDNWVKVPSPKYVNGVTCYKGQIFAVSWDQHDVYQLDPAAKKAPKAFKLSKYFTALDGIEVMDNGAIIVSDFVGGQLCLIEPDRKTVHTLATLASPADIGIDRENNLLYVPLLLESKVVVFKLNKNH